MSGSAATELRQEIAAIATDLVKVHDRLVALRAALPDLPEGVAGALSAEDRVELVGTIECVLHDGLVPAIRSLRALTLPARPRSASRKRLRPTPTT